MAGLCAGCRVVVVDGGRGQVLGARLQQADVVRGTQVGCAENVVCGCGASADGTDVEPRADGRVYRLPGCSGCAVLAA